LSRPPPLGERPPESAGLPSLLYRGLGLLLRDPGIAVRDDGNVPVTGDPRRRVDGFGPVERSGNVVPFDDLITVVGRPDLSLDELPEFVTLGVVVPPRNQDRDRVLPELRLQPQALAVTLPPRPVCTVVRGCDPFLVLSPALQGRGNHLHERVLRQPRLVHAEREALVKPAAFPPGVVETADLVHDLSR